ncbi:YghX family hydrolase [Escherichia coli]
MPRLTAKDFPQELLDYYDYYAHGKSRKREFLNLAAKYAVGGMLALALFDLLKPNYALATQVEFTDPEIVAEYITYPSPNGHGEVRGYLVKPAKMSGKTPAVVVVHENRGLNPYIEDVARRVAKAGYIALAPDGLSSVGGYPGNDDKGRELQQQVDPTKLMNDFFAAIEFMQRYPQAAGKVGITGFCYGGGVSNAAAVAYPELARCRFMVVRHPLPMWRRLKRLYYSTSRNWTPVSMRAGLLTKAALKANNKVYEAYIYPGVNHGFHNDSTPRYDKSAADLAWQRTLKWFDKYLS